MAVKHLQKRYYEILDGTLNSEFVRKSSRAYFNLSDLKYKGGKISVAIPLRANINQNFQRSPDEIIATAPTTHTRPGFIAGWHITKMIPFDGSLFTQNTTGNIDLIIAEKIAQAYISKMKKAAQDFLDRLESGEIIFGAIEFDKAFNEMEKLKKILIKEKQGKH